MTAPRRIQLRRTKGWRKPPGTIVVSRPSRWGNPFTVDSYRADYPDANDRELRRMAVSDFRGMLDGRWPAPDGAPAYPDADEIRATLAGHDLACWCPEGGPCHGDELLAFIASTMG